LDEEIYSEKETQRLLVGGRWKRVREKRETKLIKLNKCKWARRGTDHSGQIRETIFATNSISLNFLNKKFL
jgi:hypothetical protein